MRCMHVGLCLIVAAACRSAGSVPEDGAILLQVTCASDTPAPDELRAWVYDDDSVLWSDVRLQGQQAIDCSGSGSVLVQPGSFQGSLRIHLRAFAGGVRVADGALTNASLQGSRIFRLLLDPIVPVDADGDDVPDVIDDCLGVPNPAQGGCALPDAAPADAGDGDTADAGRPQGAQCSSGLQCASGYCSDGVCCTNSCEGPCRSCNQPSAPGICTPYVSGTDPSGDCGDGTACNGFGDCGPASTTKKPDGQLCTSPAGCISGFCADGVCCNSACSNTCQSCGTGTCITVTRTDDIPECTDNLTCNNKGKCVSK